VSTAKLRFEAIKDVQYDVDLILPKGDWYAGRVAVTFNLLQMPTSELFLDFRGVKVADLSINNQLFDADFYGHHLNLPKQGL